MEIEIDHDQCLQFSNVSSKSGEDDDADWMGCVPGILDDEHPVLQSSSIQRGIQLPGEALHPHPGEEKIPLGIQRPKG